MNSTWPHTSVDDFILAKLREHGTQPAVAADTRALLRRATYDLTGLPPTAETFRIQIFLCAGEERAILDLARQPDERSSVVKMGFT